MADEFFFADAGSLIDLALEEARTLSPDAGAGARLEHLSAFACLHAAVRIELIIDRLAETGWRPLADVTREDAIGASPENLERLIRNARCWAGRTRLTQPLYTWFGRVGAALLEQHGAPGPDR